MSHSSRGTELTSERSRSCSALPSRLGGIGSQGSETATADKPTQSVTDLLEIELVVRLLGLGTVIYLIGYLELGMTLVCILLAGVYTWERNNRQHDVQRIRAEFSYQLYRQQPAPEGTTQRAQWLEELIRTSWPKHKPNYDRWFEEQMKVWVTWIPPGQVPSILQLLVTAILGRIHTSGQCAAS